MHYWINCTILSLSRTYYTVVVRIFFSPKMANGGKREILKFPLNSYNFDVFREQYSWRLIHSQKLFWKWKCKLWFLLILNKDSFFYIRTPSCENFGWSLASMFFNLKSLTASRWKAIVFRRSTWISLCMRLYKEVIHTLYTLKLVYLCSCNLWVLFNQECKVET